MFSLFYADMYAGPEARESYIPQAGGMLLKESSIWLPDRSDPSQYLVMTSTDIQAPEQLVDSQALFVGYGEVYVSNENIYWYEAVSRNTGLGWVTDTQIRKVSYQDGHLKVLAKGTVPGYINDSFSIDEYGGNLRVVTTDERDNGLYILGPDLEELGSIENLAKDEQVYSARLMGDTGYFVTFRNTDPLFSVDLSDPEDPQVLGRAEDTGLLRVPASLRGRPPSRHRHGRGRGDGSHGGHEAEHVRCQRSGGCAGKRYFCHGKCVQRGCALRLQGGPCGSGEEPHRLFRLRRGAGSGTYVFSYGPGERVYLPDGGAGQRRRLQRSPGAVHRGTLLYVVKGNIIEMYRMEDYKKTGDLIL